MGKVKNKKYKPKQINPVGLPSIKELELEVKEFLIPETIDTGFIESVKEKLLSRRAEDRECGAVIIANLANNNLFVSSLIDNKIIKIASPLLIDKNPSVRHAVAGCLRNIAVCGDYTVSEVMVEQDVMTSLVMLFEMYKSHWTPVEDTENKIDSKQEIFLEACNLLWNLCENSDLAVKIFNKKDLVSVLLPCLNVNVFGFNVPLAVAQCLYTVTENNKPLKDVLKQPSVDSQLTALLSVPDTGPQEILLKTLVAGIKFNVCSGQLDTTCDTIALILANISLALMKPVEPILEVLSKMIMSHKDKKLKNINEENDLEDKYVAVNKTQENVTHLLCAHQAALEILGNLFEDEDEEEWEDASGSDSEEAALDMGDMEVDEANVSANELGPSFPPEIHQIIVNEKLWEKVAQQIIYPPEEIMQVLGSHSKTKDCLKRIDTVRCTALLCLNNILQKLKVEELGGSEKLWNLWLHLGTLLFKTDLCNTDQVEALTRVLSAVVKQLAQAKCFSQFSHMTETDLQLLMNIASQSQDSQIKVHIIHIVGTIGSILGNIDSPTSASLIKIIGSFLLDICNKSFDMWVTAETLDKIFDVFAEDHIDFIAKEIGLVEKLTHLVPVLKAKIKQQKKHLGDQQLVITTAKTNLLRFIKYKNDLNKK